MCRDVCYHVMYIYLVLFYWHNSFPEFLNNGIVIVRIRLKALRHAICSFHCYEIC